MALTLDEILPLLGDITTIIKAGEDASKTVSTDASDLTNAVTIVKAVIPPLCDLLLKVERDARD